MLKRFLKKGFTFTRHERNGIIVLLSVLFAVVITPRVYLLWFYGTNGKQYPASEELFYLVEQLKNTTDKPSELFIFDPNIATDEELMRLGLNERQVRNINNYIAAGGVYHSVEDLLRMYTIDSALYMKLEPYVQISGDKQQTGSDYVDNIQREEKRDPLKLELNSADEGQLMELRGIGPVYSSRIVSYRELLGGFVRPAQLTEVYGIDEELFLQLEPQLFADTNSIRKICLNSADFSVLLRHPYLDYEQVSAVFSYRDTAGMFKSVTELVSLGEFTREDLEQLRYYIVVN